MHSKRGVRENGPMAADNSLTYRENLQEGARPLRRRSQWYAHEVALGRATNPFDT